MEINNITKQILSCAYRFYKALGPGLLESAYRKCLANELRRVGLRVEEEVMLPITFNDTVIDYGYRIDILVENIVILELKVVDSIIDVHEAQLLTYLKFAKKPVGLLLNFNVKSLKNGIRRFVMYRYTV